MSSLIKEKESPSSKKRKKLLSDCEFFYNQVLNESLNIFETENFKKRINKKLQELNKALNNNGEQEGTKQS